MEKDKSTPTPLIELRSEKVRNILGQRPGLLIRYGTVIITLIMAAAAVIAFKIFHIPLRY